MSDRKARVRLDSLSLGDRFILRLYNRYEKDPVLTTTGTFKCIYGGNPAVCVVEFDGVDGEQFEHSHYEVEKIEGE